MLWVFCRFLLHLKKFIRNHAAIEASIAKSYICYEIATFVSNYFEPDARSRNRRPRRNDEVVNDPRRPQFSIFNFPGRPYGGESV